MMNTDMLISIFNEYRDLAVLISLCISIIISLIGVLPSIFVTGANILFFGGVWGILISLLGETIGAYITFKVYRMGFRKHFENIEGKYKLLDDLMVSRGKKAGMLIAEGRLIPFMPSGFVTLASSLSSVDGVVFTLATFIGKIPSILIEGLVSYDIINISENYIRLFFTILSLLLLYITLKPKR